MRTSNNVNRKLASDNKLLADTSGPDGGTKLIKLGLSGEVKEMPPQVFTLFPSQPYEEALLGTRYALPETVMELVSYYLALSKQLNFWMESTQLNPYKLKERILFVRQSEQLASVLERLQEEVNALLPN